MKEKIYEIEIEETLQKVIEVKAFSLDEAINKVNDQYNNQEIVLDYEDFKEVKFNEYNNCKPKKIYTGSYKER